MYKIRSPGKFKDSVGTCHAWELFSVGCLSLNYGLARDTNIPLEQGKASELVKDDKELLSFWSFGVDIQRCPPYRSEARYYWTVSWYQETLTWTWKDIRKIKPFINGYINKLASTNHENPRRKYIGIYHGIWHVINKQYFNSHPVF